MYMHKLNLFPKSFRTSFLPTGITHSFGEIDTPVEAGAIVAKNGSILTIHRHDIDTADALLLVGGALVGMHLVYHCRKGVHDE